VVLGLSRGEVVYAELVGLGFINQNAMSGLFQA